VRLSEAQDVFDKMLYTICNPVSSFLVEDSRLWPGLCSRPEQIGAEARGEDASIRVRHHEFRRVTYPASQRATVGVTYPASQRATVGTACRRSSFSPAPAPDPVSILPVSSLPAAAHIEEPSRVSGLSRGSPTAATHREGAQRRRRADPAGCRIQVRRARHDSDPALDSRHFQDPDPDTGARIP